LEIASEHLHRLARAQEQAAGPRFLLGRIAADRGALEEACGWLEAGLELDPLHCGGWMLLALVRFRVGLDRESCLALQRLLFLSPQHALARYYLGLVHQRLDQPEPARKAYRAALDSLAQGGWEHSADPLLGAMGIEPQALQAACRSRLLALDGANPVNGSRS
jgi:tetratricopeptide (TPR) repeat protein